MNKSAPQLGVFTWSCAACCSAETCAMRLDDLDVTGALPATVGSLSCRSKIVELYAQDRTILPTTPPHLPTDASSALVHFRVSRAVAGCGAARDLIRV
jgi:hypothetical protein